MDEPKDVDIKDENKDGLAAAADNVDSQKIKLTINGEEKELSMEEVISLASKAGGADEKFREASEIRKSSSVALKTLDVMQKINSGGPLTEEDAKILSSTMGGSPEFYLNAYSSIVNSDDADDDSDDGPSLEDLLDEYDVDFDDKESGSGNEPSSNNKTTKTEKGKTMDDNKELKNTINELKEDKNRRDAELFIKKVNEDCGNSLDKSEFLVNIIGEDNQRREVLRNKLYEEVERFVVVAGAEYGPDVINKAIKKLESEVKTLGIPTAGKKDSDKSKLPISGLGPATGISQEDIFGDKEPEDDEFKSDDGFASSFAKKVLRGVARSRSLR
jgi:hypothetical protein